MSEPETRVGRAAYPEGADTCSAAQDTDETPLLAQNAWRCAAGSLRHDRLPQSRPDRLAASAHLTSPKHTPDYLRDVEGEANFDRDLHPVCAGSAA